MDHSGDQLASEFSHLAYLDTLHRPSIQEWQRISRTQLQKEAEIDAKYHQSQTAQEEHEAATTIQKAYRGHRERRQLGGLVLDPSGRWVDLIREMRYRAATVPHETFGSPPAVIGRPRTVSSAQMNWQRAGVIAEHAVEGESPPGSDLDEPGATPSVEGDLYPSKTTLQLDLRYFLEMVDQRHRYGANLQVYHEEWQRSGSNKNFFYWLDQGDGRDFDLPGCTRAKLEKERIRYLSKDERMAYLVKVDEDGKLRWDKTRELISTSQQYKDSMGGIVSVQDADAPSFESDTVQQRLDEEYVFARELAKRQDSARLTEEIAPSPFDSKDGVAPCLPGAALDVTAPTAKPKRKHFHVSPATILNHLLRATVKPGTWIYVADTLGRLYVGIKSSGTFQHTSFLAGARISSAGLISIEQGRLTYLSPLSGHYRPTTSSFRTFIGSLKDRDVDITQLKVSHAYEVLLTMETYGRVKKKVHTKQPKGAAKSEVPHTSHDKTDESHEKQQRSAPTLMERAREKVHEHFHHAKG